MGLPVTDALERPRRRGAHAGRRAGLRRREPVRRRFGEGRARGSFLSPVRLPLPGGRFVPHRLSAQAAGHGAPPVGAAFGGGGAARPGGQRDKAARPAQPMHTGGASSCRGTAGVGTNRCRKRAPARCSRVGDVGFSRTERGADAVQHDATGASEVGRRCRDVQEALEHVEGLRRRWVECGGHPQLGGGQRHVCPRANRAAAWGGAVPLEL